MCTTNCYFDNYKIYHPWSMSRVDSCLKMSCLFHWTTFHLPLHRLDKDMFLHCRNNLKTIFHLKENKKKRMTDLFVLFVILEKAYTQHVAQ